MEPVIEHPLVEFRRKRNLTRAQAAELLGCTVAMVGHVERGVRSFSPERAKALEEQGKVPAAVLRPDLFAVRACA